jgi:hypothetical protein
MKPSSIGIGFSHHRVPSLSNPATRSAGGTNSGDPSAVTRPTNSRMAAAAGPSFQLASPPEGSWEVMD